MWDILWSSRLNRKWYFFLNWLLLFILHMAIKMSAPPEIVQIISYTMIVFSIFIVRSRCNDIGIQNQMQFVIQAIMLLSVFLPLIAIIPNLYLLFKRGMYSDCPAETKSSFMERMKNKYHDTIMEQNDSIFIIRKLFIIIFCIATFIMCLIPPYHIVHPKVGERFIGYGTITTPPKDLKNITIDYKRLLFQEIILLAVCGAGYTIITINKK